jgi:hypothetical protein
MVAAIIVQQYGSCAHTIYIYPVELKNPIQKIVSFIIECQCCAKKKEFIYIYIFGVYISKFIQIKSHTHSNKIASQKIAIC